MTAKCVHCGTALPKKRGAFIVEADGTFHPPTRCVEILKAKLGAAERHNVELHRIASELLDLSEEGWTYANEYFRDKWLGDQHEQFRATLARLGVKKEGEGIDEQRA